jgi:hypothetical protein
MQAFNLNLYNIFHHIDYNMVSITDLIILLNFILQVSDHLFIIIMLAIILIIKLADHQYLIIIP